MPWAQNWGHKFGSWATNFSMLLPPQAIRDTVHGMEVWIGHRLKTEGLLCLTTGEPKPGHLRETR